MYEEVASDGYIEHVEFLENQGWSVGRTDSKSCVFFGDMIFQTLDKEVQLPVACKPFHGWTNGAVHEFTAYEHINAMGFIKTFSPIGFWVDDNNNVFLLSIFEENVITLDNVNWRQTQEIPLKNHFTAFDALERAGYTIGRFVAHGYAHRDAQVKNIAYDGTSIRAVDLESIRLIQTPENPNPIEMGGAVLKDAKDFIESINRSNYLSDSDIARRGNIIYKHFATPLLSTLRHPSTMLQRDYGQDGSKLVSDLNDSLKELLEVRENA
jgi:hypothetical protein